MKIKYSQEFLFEGTENELMDKIKSISRKSDYSKALGFYSHVYSENEFRITAYSSLGTMIVNYWISPTIGISAFGRIEKLDDKQTKVIIKTKTRFEIYFFVAFIIVMYIGMINSDQIIPFWVFLIPLIVIPWFHLVYRFQEDNIIENLIYSVGLKEM